MLDGCFSLTHLTDPNTKRFKRTLNYYDTDTKSPSSSHKMALKQRLKKKKKKTYLFLVDLLLLAGGFG